MDTVLVDACFYVRVHTLCEGVCGTDLGCPACVLQGVSITQPGFSRGFRLCDVVSGHDADYCMRCKVAARVLEALVA